LGEIGVSFGIKSDINALQCK